MSTHYLSEASEFSPEPARPGLWITTLGCRLNQYESEKLAAEISACGFRRVDTPAEAALAIINTCTVTHRADADCRQLINRTIREHPQAAVVVAGCYVDANPELVQALPGVRATLRNKEKSQAIPALRERLAPTHPMLAQMFNDPSESAHIAPDFSGQHRAWLKLSDGCNQWCSYCILPTVRGRLANRAPQEIFRDLRGLTDRGFQEIVLTGINVGHYSWRQTQPEYRNVADLIRRMLQETSGVRFRLSSIEPQTVRPELRALYGEGDERMCRHWHLPLQSGSDKILRLMRRPYAAASYRRLAESLKAARPGTVIGADVIVGFPGEAAADYQETIALCSSGLIDYLHVFRYSDRRGTVASAIREKVSPEVISERAAQLNKLDGQLRRAAMQREIGSLLGVIGEGRASAGWISGMSDNFLKVRYETNHYRGYAITPVRVTGIGEDSLFAEIVEGRESSLPATSAAAFTQIQ